MKRRFLLAAILALSMGVCSLGLFACSKTATVGGTYYYYENGKYDGAMYIKFGDTKWLDDEERSGDYKINGKNIVLYAGDESENNVFLSGTVKGDEVKLNVSGEQYVYKKNADLDILPEKTLVFEPNADKTAYTVTGVGELSGDIVVPDTYKKKPVIEIASEAFYNNESLTSVKIGNNVTSVGDAAFSRCYNLERVRIGDNVTSIGSGAFYNCGALEHLTIGNNVIRIGEDAFRGNNSLYYVHITDIAAWCNIEFENEYSNPIAISGMGGLFMDVAMVKNVVIPQGVTSIGRYAFYNYDPLIGVEIPSSVTSIGDHAFFGCDNLESITIPSSVTSIGAYAFFGCDNFESITIPSSVTRIGSGAFGACGNAILYCEAVSRPSDWSSSWNPNSRPVVWNCKKNDKDENGYAYPIIGEIRYRVKDGTAVVIKQSEDVSGAITIPSFVSYKGDPYNVTSIGEEAFYDCRSLTSITIPNSVTSIGYGAFGGCSSLTSVTLPSGITSIKEKTFYYCSRLTNVTIPNGVTNIGNRAFQHCAGLTSVEIPQGVKKIGMIAFCDCFDLVSITIPSSVENIGGDAFSNCDKLTIYCEAESKPSGWESDWNPENRPVVWDYKNK